MNTKHSDSEIIDALGGTCVVARLLEVKPPSISKWRHTGIPRARMMYLKAVHPEVFQADKKSAVLA